MHPTISCVSGYFDPIHVGHIEYFKNSKNIADKLMVIVNNDEQAILKKGKAFMPADERIKLRDGFGNKIQSSSWLIKGKKY